MVAFVRWSLKLLSPWIAVSVVSSVTFSRVISIPEALALMSEGAFSFALLMRILQP